MAFVIAVNANVIHFMKENIAKIVRCVYSLCKEVGPHDVFVLRFYLVREYIYQVVFCLIIVVCRALW